MVGRETTGQGATDELPLAKLLVAHCEVDAGPVTPQESQRLITPPKSIGRIRWAGSGGPAFFPTLEAGPVLAVLS